MSSSDDQQLIEVHGITRQFRSAANAAIWIDRMRAEWVAKGWTAQSDRIVIRYEDTWTAEIAFYRWIEEEGRGWQ